MVRRLLLRAGIGLLLALPGTGLAQDNSQQPPIYSLPGNAGNFHLPPAGSQPATPKTATAKPTTPKPASDSASKPAPERHSTEHRKEKKPPETSPPAVAPTKSEAATTTPAPAESTPIPPSPPKPSPAAPPSTPAPTPTPTQTATLDAPPSPLVGGVPVWSWGIGILLLGLIGSGAILSRRKRPVAELPPTTTAETETRDAPPAPVEPAVAPTPAPASPTGLIVTLHPLNAGIVNGEAAVRVEISITNRTGKRAEDISAVLAMMSASPEQDRLLARFQIEARVVEPSFAPFTLVPGESRQLVADLVLDQNRLHIVMHGDRPMFVPIVAVSLRWRSGLNLHTQGEAYMIGTSDGVGGKLGPFWFDRGDGVYRRVSARHYQPDADKAAAG